MHYATEKFALGSD